MFLYMFSSIRFWFLVISPFDGVVEKVNTCKDIFVKDFMFELCKLMTGSTV